MTGVPGAGKTQVGLDVTARHRDRADHGASRCCSTHRNPYGLAKRCRARRQKLEPVQGDPAIRFCTACERSIYLCQTDEDLSKHSALGRCVALEIPVVGVAHLGQPMLIQDLCGARESGSGGEEP
ncbi:MAG: hypothetical protein AB7E72_03355 [Lysobacterales bacterium]